MNPLNRFGQRIEQLDRRPADADAFRRLIDELRLYPWETAAERDRAQGLVGRLERQMYRAGQQAA
jgi:hypothetical protein